MKQTVLDVLIYMFENYMEDDELQPGMDHETLRTQLSDAGFDSHQIGKAFDWLEGLSGQPGITLNAATSSQATRVYADLEIRKIDLESRGFLMFLEQAGVIDPVARELVIDRLMALETEEIDLDQLKWVVLMVLFNQPGQEEAFVWMEDLVMDELGGPLH